MAYSQEIIQIISDKVAAITTTVTMPTVPAFYTKQMWDFNQFTDAIYPLIVVDRPITESSKILLQGNPQKKYNLFIYIFAGTVEVNANHATYKEPMLILAEEIKTALLKPFIAGFISAGIGKVDPIESYKSDEIPEFKNADSNPVGLLLQLPIVFTSLKSLC